MQDNVDTQCVSNLCTVVNREDFDGEFKCKSCSSDIIGELSLSTKTEDGLVKGEENREKQTEQHTASLEIRFCMSAPHCDDYNHDQGWRA